MKPTEPKREEGDDDNVDGGGNVDEGREMEVTTTVVNNVTCCGGRATNRNRDEMYVRRHATIPETHFEETVDEDEQSSSTTLPEKVPDKWRSRIILEIKTIEDFSE